MVVSIKFVSDLDYQIKAVNSIADLFEGVLAKLAEIPIFGINQNPEIVSLEMLNANLNAVQEQNKLSKTQIQVVVESDLYGRPNFSIEMETGTGKTYIFLRSILEMNKRFGLKKFIVVVPSVAIREGVLANLRLTKQHFQQLFDRVPYNYRVFSSEKLADLSAFCRSNLLEIMVITIQSFNKEKINTLYDKGRDDVFLAESGIEMLAQTKPVLILDEPHKMGSELSNSALNNLNPLFVLRYSATHKDLDKTHLVYSLGPMEAHQLGLVKKIDVIGTSIVNEASLPVIKLLEVKIKPKIKAKLLLKVRTAKGMAEKSLWVEKGDYLIKKTNNPAYKNSVVLNISGQETNQWVELSGGVKIKQNQAIGDTYLQVAKEQIKNTIVTHFEKQEKLKKFGIKVLSLFFLDEVSDYQELDETIGEGAEQISQIDEQKYLFVKKTFDEVFESMKKNYSDWKSKSPQDVRGAYFSAKKTFKSISQDKEKIDEILRDKEKLLSFESPTSFIFSHSALAEGWDNPNVFNICTLRITSSVVTKRQTIGRGLRIPVDQMGKRFENPFENNLTVIANESYADFARGLQQDYENEGILTAPPIENRRDKVIVKLQSDRFKGEFNEIWGHLKIKTMFESEINTEELIKKCLQQINQELFVTKPLLMSRRARLEFSKNEILQNEMESDNAKEVELEYSIPDVVTRIANETKLTKKTVAKILLESEKLNEIFNNPEEFIFKTAKIIKDQKIRMEVTTATYSKVSEKYDDSIFPLEIEVYQSNVIESNSAVYDKVICDTPSEIDFAKKLTNDEQVNLFSKLPQEYYISTPVGNYRPDWAIIYQRKRIGGKMEGKLYLVRETKFGYSQIAGTLESISDEEQGKINCAIKHFNEIGVINFKVVNSYENFKQTLPN